MTPTAHPGERGEVAVLIAAAGSGTRLGGRRKQFRMLGERPVLVETLLVFERHPEIDHILVATPKEAVRPLRQELRRVGITKLQAVVSGGSNRQASVRAALKAVPDSVDVVLVHDAVRPFVRLSLVSDVVEAAREFGAAAAAVPVTDTVRRSAGLDFGDAVPREGLFAMQTPQGFRRDWLDAAHLEHEALDSTDDVEVIQRAGHPVRMVIGSTDNVKITTKEDWERAQVFWPVWEESLRMESGARGIVIDPVTGDGT